MNILHQLAETYYYSSRTTSGTDSLDPAFYVALGVFYFFSFVISYVLYGIFLGFIFKKAGIPSWVAWVPFYNTWKMLEIGGQQGFWAVLAIIPFVNIVSAVFMYIAMYNIGLKFGKSTTFVLLGIFLPIVWLIWLGIDSSKWSNALGAPSLAIEHTTSTPTAAV